VNKARGAKIHWRITLWRIHNALGYSTFRCNPDLRVLQIDPKEDPDEYEDDETKDGPVDYPMDGGDDGDDDDCDSSGDDTDEEDEDDEDEEEEEEEHLAPADSAIVVPTVEHVSPPEGTELVIPPPSTDITIRARIIVWP
ncbi:hypothetical protein Tco_1259635, partial [Tanacetum coccineum]